MNPAPGEWKRGQKVRRILSGAGTISAEVSVVLRVNKKGVWLDNGPGNEPSGPFDPTTGKKDGMFGFSERIEAVR